MIDLLLATGNRDKVKEISAMLADLSINILSAADRPDLPEVVEDQDTFEGNASKKALTLAKVTGMLALADDSGLVVPALNGDPGVYSARYAGEDVTYADNNRKLIESMKDLPDGERSAYFITVASVADPSGVIGTAEGRVHGQILREPRGDGGFGYDPLFYHEPSGATFAEISLEMKNRVSHRAQALEGAKKILARLAIGNLE